jgi:23S rRNA (cytosine1962-C5)-methyltransferase
MFEVNGTVVVRGKIARSAWRRGPWLRDEDLISRDNATGPFVDLVDENSLPLGTGLLGSTPERAVRFVTSARTRDPLALLRTRLERADSRRRTDLLGADAYRVCHGEADGVPGVFVDRFGPGLLVRPDSPEVAPLAEALCGPLVEITRAETVALWPAGGAPRLILGDDPVVRFHHGRLVLTVDMLRGRGLPDMSGQLENQRFVRRWAKGRVLDAFAGYGGYGLQLADAGARHVTCVENDERLALSIADDASRNALTELAVVREDPMDHLRGLDDASERFDIVVTHPPLLREPASAAEDAQRRAFDIHRRALRLLDEGGVLITWAGSTALAQDAFEEVVVDAATRNRKRLQVLARLRTGPDHPGLLGMPERGTRVTLVGRVVSMA